MKWTGILIIQALRTVPSLSHLQCIWVSRECGSLVTVSAVGPGQWAVSAASGQTECTASPAQVARRDGARSGHKTASGICLICSYKLRHTFLETLNREELRICDEDDTLRVCWLRLLTPGSAMRVGDWRVQPRAVSRDWAGPGGQTLGAASVRESPSARHYTGTSGHTPAMWGTPGVTSTATMTPWWVRGWWCRWQWQCGAWAWLSCAWSARPRAEGKGHCTLGLEAAARCSQPRHGCTPPSLLGVRAKQQNGCRIKV